MKHIYHLNLIQLWDKIVFPNGCQIPSLTMMEEAIFAPKLDVFFAMNILNQYEIDDLTKQKIEPIINRGDCHTFWKEITKALEYCDDPKLYSTFQSSAVQ